MSQLCWVVALHWNLKTFKKINLLKIHDLAPISRKVSSTQHKQKRWVSNYLGLADQSIYKECEPGELWHTWS